MPPKVFEYIAFKSSTLGIGPNQYRGTMQWFTSWCNAEVFIGSLFELWRKKILKPFDSFGVSGESLKSVFTQQNETIVDDVEEINVL